MPRQPSGFTTLFPYLMVDDARGYLTYLHEGLAGEVIAVHDAPDGGVANAMVRFGDTTIMLSDARDIWPATTGTYYLYVDDADAAMARALSTGGHEIMPVEDRPFGDRQGGVRDPRGNIWWLSQRLTDGPYSD